MKLDPQKNYVTHRIEVPPSAQTDTMKVTGQSRSSDGTVRLEGYVNAYVVIHPDGRVERRS